MRYIVFKFHQDTIKTEQGVQFFFQKNFWVKICQKFTLNDPRNLKYPCTTSVMAQNDCIYELFTKVSS